MQMIIANILTFFNLPSYKELLTDLTSTDFFSLWSKLNLFQGDKLILRKRATRISTYLRYSALYSRLDRRILDKICLYFLFFIWRRDSEISKTFFIPLYNINVVRDLTPSRHSAMNIYFNLIFKSGKNLSGFTEFGNIQTSGNHDRSSIFFSSMPSYLHFCSRQYPV